MLDWTPHLGFSVCVCVCVESDSAAAVINLTHWWKWMMIHNVELGCCRREMLQFSLFLCQLSGPNGADGRLVVTLFVLCEAFRVLLPDGAWLRLFTAGHQDVQLL